MRAFLSAPSLKLPALTWELPPHHLSVPSHPQRSRRSMGLRGLPHPPESVRLQPRLQALHLLTRSLRARMVTSSRLHLAGVPVATAARPVALAAVLVDPRRREPQQRHLQECHLCLGGKCQILKTSLRLSLNRSKSVDASHQRYS